MNRIQRAAGKVAGDNTKPVDGWTVVHGTAGFVSGMVGSPWWLTLAGAVMWEVREDQIKARWPDYFPDATPDSGGNAATDVGAAMIGWYLAARVRS